RDAIRLLKRLVRVPEPNEAAPASALAIPASHLDDIERGTVTAFTDAHVLTTRGSEEQEVICIAEPVIIEAWAPLQLELKADQKFLRWRQGLPAAEWAKNRD